MLTGSNQQIIESYETLNMSPEEISESLDFDLVAVKATLMQFSSKYRTAMKTEPELDFNTDEQLEAKNAIVRLMRSSEDENLVARLAMRIRDDAKGRLDIAKNMNGINVNVNIFNDRLKEAQRAIERSKQSAKILDVESEKVNV